MKVRKRIIYALLLVITVVILLSACGKQAQGSETLQRDDDGKAILRYQGSTGGVTLPELATYLGYFNNISLQWVGNVNGGPQDIQAAATNQTDFGSAFNGAIVKLRGSGAKITSVIGSYGTNEKEHLGIYVLEDSAIDGVEQLVGKSIAVNTLGAHAEFAIKDILRSAGLTDAQVKEVTLIVIPPINMEQSLRQKQVDAIMTSGMIRELMIANGGVKKIASDYEQYGTFTAGSYVFRDSFIDQYPDVVRDFTQGVARAIDWLKVTPKEEVIATYTTIINDRQREENTNAVQYFISTSIDSDHGLLTEEDFARWLTWLIENGDLKEGSIKPSDVYTNEFNEFAAP
ncbi:ABC transporter substrate-binding protein [Paenibacillus endoradicis]|uniref:ABC transporter substrate-binding protein n=1 Tax=Paenibacillus endoradicis TaxID=2972487 RepID=UPI0021592E3B|nr:ABC transporter substrate-binding protein [Paenibacillus endoradicis]MCR8657156.1 ABC transporter substrate-binding protein [Paenibacillus endoradicis]